jgi:hypothetical protein
MIQSSLPYSLHSCLLALQAFNILLPGFYCLPGPIEREGVIALFAGQGNELYEKPSALSYPPRAFDSSSGSGSAMAWGQQSTIPGRLKIMPREAYSLKFFEDS